MHFRAAYVFMISVVLLPALAVRTSAAAPESAAGPVQEVMTLEEYLEKGGEEWFLTGKKEYPVQAMMVSKETSVHNDYEVVDYTVTDDGESVILKGTTGELWVSRLPKVISTYTKPDGSAVSAEDFAEKDVFIDLVTIPSSDTNFAMFVPNTVSVTVNTAWGDVLHTNLPNSPHGSGDYLICRVGDDGEPDLSDVWVMNGALFPNNYDTSHLNETEGAADSADSAE